MKSLVGNYKNLNYKDFCYNFNSAILLEASECCGQNCQECDFFVLGLAFCPVLADMRAQCFLTPSGGIDDSPSKTFGSSVAGVV